MVFRVGVAGWLALLACALGGCSNRSIQESAINDTRRVIYTDNYPIAYFAKRIGQEYVDVRFPAPPEADPEFWQPDPATIEAYQKADLILLNGTGYAKWVDRASLPPRKVVDTSAAFHDKLIEIPNAITHSHGPQGAHTHAGLAFDTWLDFQQALQQADAIYSALRDLMPAQGVFLQTNYDRLHKDLEAYDVRLDTAFTAWRGQPLLASHPVYQYLARRYGLDLESVHWEPTEMPDEAEWTQLAERLKVRPVRWMIWEAQPKAEISNRLARLGVASLVFRPGANRPASGDFLSLMEENLSNMAQAAQ